MIASRFQVINELFAADSKSSDFFVGVLLDSAEKIFSEVEVSLVEI